MTETTSAIPSTRSPFSTAAFSFSWRASESKLDRWHRLFEELFAAGYISDTVRSDVLKTFLNIASTPGLPVAYIGGKAVDHVDGWKTNCAMTQHAAQCWCGRFMKPDVNGESIEQYVELVRNDKYWVKNDGAAAPQGPCVFYVGPSPALGYDHVGAFGALIEGRHYQSYEGGGGDGTKVGHNDRHLDKPDSFGRRIQGWWEIAPLLPESADLCAGEVVRDALDDEMGRASVEEPPS